MDKIEAVNMKFNPTPTIMKCVSGTVPKELSCHIFKQVFAIYDLSYFGYNYKLKHAWDALTSMVKISINNGSVALQSRIVETDFLKHVKNKQQPYILLNTAPSFNSIFPRSIMKFYDRLKIDNPFVPFIIDSRLFLSDETNGMYEINPIDLSTIKKISSNKYIYKNFENLLSSAHPYVDVSNKKIIEVIGPRNPSFSKKSFAMDVVESSFDGQFSRDKLTTIPSRYNFFCHSPLATDNYIFINALEMHLRMGMGQFDVLRNNKQHIFLINRETNNIIEIEVPDNSLFLNHPLNIFENSNDELVVDILCDSMDYYRKLTYPFVKSEPTGRYNRKFLRCIIDLKNCTAKYTHPVDKLLSYGKISIKDRQRPTTYIYAVGVKSELSLWKDQLCKVNVKDSLVEHIWEEEGMYVNEPSLIEFDDNNPAIISFIAQKPEHQKSYLILLYADSFKEIARLETPNYIPFHVHGICCSYDYKSNDYSP